VFDGQAGLRKIPVYDMMPVGGIVKIFMTGGTGFIGSNWPAFSITGA